MEAGPILAGEDATRWTTAAVHAGLRVLGAFLVLFLFVNLLFLSINVWGDPVELLVPRDPKIPEEYVLINCRTFGLCGPDGFPLSLPARYVLFLENLWQGDFGVSYYWRGLPVSDVLREAIPATVELLLAASLIALGLGFVLATVARRYRHRGADAASRLSGALLAGLPILWFAFLLQYTARSVLPVSGRLDFGLAKPPLLTGMHSIDALLAGQFGTFANALQHLAVPALALGIPMGGFVARALRRYAERSLAGPSPATSMTFPVGALLGGALVVEWLTSRDGVGRMFLDAIRSFDLPAAIGATVALLALGVVIATGLSILELVLEPTRFLAAYPTGVPTSRIVTSDRFPLARRLLYLGSAFVGVVIVAIALGTFLDPVVVSVLVVASFIGLGIFAGWMETARGKERDPMAAARAAPEEVASRAARAYRRFGSVSSGFAWTGLILLFVVAGIAALAPLLAPYPVGVPTGPRAEAPSATHWLGTDPGGEDSFSRLLFAARGTLLPLGIALLLPAGIGYVAGLALLSARRRPSILSGLILDPMRGVPELLVVSIFLVPVFGATRIVLYVGYGSELTFVGLWELAMYSALLGLALTPAFVRALRNRLVAQPRASWLAGGSRDVRRLHAVFPGLLSMLALEVVLIQAAISFMFGFPGFVDWAGEIARADTANALLNGYWWMFVPPGLMIVLVALGFALLGEGLAGRDETRPWRMTPFPAPRFAPPVVGIARTSSEGPSKTAPPP